MSYSREYTLFELFQLKFMPKTTYLIEKGYYKVISGAWRNDHLHFISKQQFNKCSLKKLKQIIQ